MISRKRAAELADKYETTPAFIRRLAVFVEETGRGVNPYDSLNGMGLSAADSIQRYKAWAKQLRPELAEAETASELATPSGDVLADTAGRPSVRGGPDIGDEAERDYERSKNDPDDTPTDEGDDN